MKKNLAFIALVFSVLMLVFVSCGKSDSNPETPETPNTHWYSPEPGENGTLPESVLPAALQDSISEYFKIHDGDNPPIINHGEFVSHPHMLLFSNYSSSETDTIGSVYNDRYIAFIENGNKMDFYGKQWDDEYEEYYEEAYRGLNVLGSGENFTCYYLTEGYPNGMYAKQSTVFSGAWTPSSRGLRDFQVAVILLETSGNPSLAPAGSFRVLGDGDGLAETDNWMEGKSESCPADMTDNDPFRMFRVK